MRRTLGIILTGLGAFLVVAGLLVRFYAYPTLAVAPIDQDSVTRLSATDATVFSIDELAEITTDLSIAATTRGNVEAAEKQGDGVVVWVGTTTVRTSDGSIISQDASSTALDAHTAEAVDCCNNFVESNAGDRVPIKRSGLVYKFPFNTQKQTYNFFDDSAGKAFPAKYKGEKTIEGVKTYVFVQEIPRQVIGEREVPASILGEKGEDAVFAEQYYMNTRTMYVEPNTGAFIQRVEEQYQTLAFEGEDRVVATEATVSFTPEQVKEFADQIGSQGPLLGLVRNVIPWVMLLLGVILVGLGIFLRRGAERKAAAHEGAAKHERGAKATV